VQQIYEALVQKPDDLLSNDRFFVREGYLHVWDDKKSKMKKRYAFLFNDILLLTKKEKGKKYWLRVHVSLRSSKANVVDMTNTFQFTLQCKSRSFIFQTTEAQLKTAWMDDLRGSISGKHEEKQRIINRDRDELLQPKKKYNQITVDEINVESPIIEYENNNQKIQKVEQETNQEDIPITNENPVPKRKKSKKGNNNNQTDILSIIDNPTTYNPFETPNPFLDNSNTVNNPFTVNNTNNMNYPSSGFNFNENNNSNIGFNNTNNTNNMNYSSNGFNFNEQNNSNNIQYNNPFLIQNTVPPNSNPFTSNPF